MAYDFLLGCLGIYVFCPMGFAHDMWWGTYVKCMLCPCIFMFVLRSCSPFGWTAGRISILSIFRRRSPSPSMVRKAFVHYYRPTTYPLQHQHPYETTTDQYLGYTLVYRGYHPLRNGDSYQYSMTQVPTGLPVRVYWD